MSALAITIDVDWAPDEVLADTIAILNDAGASATIFATHPTPVLEGLDPSRFEIAVHPNLNPVMNAASDGRTALDVIDETHAMFPGAVGLRCHSLIDSPAIRERFAALGGLYESNLMLPTRIDPFWDWGGLLRIPFGFADNVHALVGGRFAPEALSPNGPGVGVLNFHPSHIFLDTENPGRYKDARAWLQRPERLIEHRNTTETPGARRLLTALLERGPETVTLRALASDWAGRLGPCPYRHPDSMKDDADRTASLPASAQGERP